jgi:hypothetical protein
MGVTHGKAWKDIVAEGACHQRDQQRGRNAIELELRRKRASM